jgi:hypothetical protein
VVVNFSLQPSAVQMNELVVTGQVLLPKEENLHQQ